MENADPIQAQLMQEQIILVDADDQVVGPASKRDCHLRTSANPSGRLHRAFSVFLFDKQNRLLLQRRAATKITFPDLWTNSCCSHPLFNESELEALEQIGVKRAAIRKLADELGISSPTLQPRDLRFVARIEYCAFQDDQIWVEHELDYLLFGRADVDICPNPNEVSDYRFVTRDELVQAISSSVQGAGRGMEFTPWFDLICREHIWRWWSDLDRILESDSPDSAIHRFGVYQPPERGQSQPATSDDTPKP